MAKFLNNIDLRQNQLKNAVIEQLVAAPSAAKLGQVYFNTTTKKFNVCVDADLQKWEAFPSLEALASAVSDLEGKIALKADQSTTYTKTEVDGLIDGVLPEQAGNNGKFLTTDGTDASWDYVINMNNITEGTNQGLSKLVINKLTKSEYDALEAAGQIKETELYITDSEAYTKEEVDASLEGLNNRLTTAESTLATKADQSTLESEVSRLEGVIENLDFLPEQTGNDGKFLTTNGTDASWSALPESTDAVKGIVKLASADEITAGTSTTAVVTVAQMTSAVSTVNGALESHTTNTENPHQVTKAQVGLGNVDNTSDADKPVSTAQQAALDLKANASDVTEALALKANAADVYTKEQVNDALALKANAANVYTKDEVDAKVSSVYRFKGSVETVDALPADGNIEGDVYNVKSTGENYAWVAPTETEEGFWDDLGGDIDLTPYLKVEDAASTYLAKTDAASTYLTQTDAASTYLTQTDATSTYATKEELNNVQTGAVHKVSQQNTELTPVDGVATWTIAHTMGTDVDVVIKEVSSNEVVFADVVLNSNEVVIKINSDATITADTYKVIILG